MNLVQELRLLKRWFSKTEIARRKLYKVIGDFLPDDPIILEGGAYRGEDSVRMSKYW